MIACTDLRGLRQYIRSSCSVTQTRQRRGGKQDDEDGGRHGVVEPRSGEAPGPGPGPDPDRQWQPEPRPPRRPLQPNVQLPQQERGPLVRGSASSPGGGGGGRRAIFTEGDLYRPGSNPEQETGAAWNASAEGPETALPVLPQGLALQSFPGSEEAQGRRRAVAVAEVGAPGRPIWRVPTAGTGFAKSTAAGVHRNKNRRGGRGGGGGGARGSDEGVRGLGAAEERAPADEVPIGAAQQRDLARHHRAVRRLLASGAPTATSAGVCARRRGGERPYRTEEEEEEQKQREVARPGGSCGGAVGGGRGRRGGWGGRGGGNGVGVAAATGIDAKQVRAGMEEEEGGVGVSEHHRELICRFAFLYCSPFPFLFPFLLLSLAGIRCMKLLSI